MDAMFRKQSLNSSKVLDSEHLSGGKHGFVVAENGDHKVAENERRLRMKAMADGYYIENQYFKKLLSETVLCFPAVVQGLKIQNREVLQEIRVVTGIRMHVTCQQDTNRMRRHLYSRPRPA